ncbi:uncharacterized protein SPAPADRAFT_59250 [Spathaspora passalidarum NRRL Y-27907]|uniref:Uncharacterized protein n=1 Tax=Spathaspora passalidarum (strain NRRL Y-27907 / 11-Y1) TaxID=619300 RepID=G3AJH2_SPAPN|nr:uncharacterized protein SPAPADRAFT_59250 [Spathaspora passalidarum NRRL Y-27907]EGW33875.1 hypothetical protein SPAPADRAFT_59250 [Spathaspora passalidarum NRRL Y-27907]
MSVYHNEVLPLLIRLDDKYAEGLGDIYSEIPKFDYQEANHEYFKPLVQPKHRVTMSTPGSASSTSPSATTTPSKSKKRPHHHSEDVTLPFAKFGGSPEADVLHQTHHLPQQPQPHLHPQPHQQQHALDESVDPALKRSRIQDQANSIDFENALATAAIAAINSEPVTNGRDPTPFYIKDRKWFNKLISLHDSGLLGVDEVLSVCEGVRDNKIPMFMLNVLDNSYYPSRTGMSEDIPDEETVKRIREFMLPMVYNS